MENYHHFSRKIYLESFCYSRNETVENHSMKSTVETNRPLQVKIVKDISGKDTAVSPSETSQALLPRTKVYQLKDQLGRVVRKPVNVNPGLNR